MKAMILCLPLFLLIQTAIAQEGRQFKSKDYEEALAAADFIHFDMESTKVGVITTSFTGVVKEFTLRYTPEKEKIKSIGLDFLVKDLDTDSDGRNEKMQHECLDMNKYPKISVNLGHEVTIKEGTIHSWALMKIRGKSKKIKLDITIKKENESYIVSGQSNVRLSELEIPDPSIAVASVDDQVKISFKFKIKL